MRLGLDIGTNSIGWWLYATDGTNITEVIDGGVRIFSDGRDPKSKASLAVDRRAARAMRRRRDRYLRRRASLMRKLAEAGLMPADPTQAKALELLDPYELRATALDDPLPLHHLGRALFHLNQRRGFKSNRKTDRGDNESGTIKDATARLDQEMAVKGARTYGEFLHKRRAAAPDPRRVPSVRTRLSIAKRGGPDAKEEAGYDFYPDRRHLEDEFAQIWEAQAAHHPDVLTDELREAVFQTIFHQRPLKEPKVGKCLFTEEDRLPKAHPLAQRRVLFETVNNLRVTSDGRHSRPLTLEERNKAILILDNQNHTKTSKNGKSKVTLKSLGAKLKLRAGERFTLETANRDAIACDPVRATMSHPDHFGPNWSKLDAKEQWRIVRRVRKLQSEVCANVVADWLMRVHGLPKKNAWGVIDAPLPEGYSRLGRTATGRILAALQSDLLIYSQAVATCGWHHSDHRTGEVLDELPYYGKILERHVIPGSFDRSRHDPVKQAAEYYGRITNPTVHIGLNQLRRLVNLIVTVHGKPDQIVVELARDLKQSEKQKAEINKRNRKNRDAAEKRSEKLVSMGQRDNGANRMKLRLWEDLNPEDCLRRFCPYSGQRITAEMLFDTSCDVDHILPYSRTLDGSFANRTICLAHWNKDKANKTPYERWGSDADKWATIAANLKYLPDTKRWRFAPDAMIEFEKKGDFLDRALTDTAYLSKIAQSYLAALYPGDDEKRHVFVASGKLTAMLRAHWGLDSLGWPEGTDKALRRRKNRNNHLHHSIDAAVLGAITPGLIQRIATAASQDEKDGQSAEDVARSTPEPWEHFRADIGIQLGKIVVSHRADHGQIAPAARKLGRDSTVGALHEATALGIVDSGHVVVRLPVAKLKPAHLREGGKSGHVRDPYLRARLVAVTSAAVSEKEFATAVDKFFAQSSRYRGTRRVRIVKALKDSARIQVPQGAPQKAYQSGSNQCFEIWKMPGGKILSQAINTWEYYNLTAPKRPHPAAKRLLRLFKNDMVAIEKGGQRIICHVQKTDPANGAFLVPHYEANADKRNSDKSDPFKWFQMSAGSLVKARIRRVFVDDMGRLRDPGPAI